MHSKLLKPEQIKIELQLAASRNHLDKKIKIKNSNKKERREKRNENGPAIYGADLNIYLGSAVVVGRAGGSCYSHQVSFLKSVPVLVNKVTQ